MTTRKDIFAETRTEGRPLQLNRPAEIALAVGSAAFIGLLTALTMPYGPITTAQVWMVMGSSLVVGVIAGLLLRTPWAILLAPLAYITLF